jgi:dihydroxyacetone kinase
VALAEDVHANVRADPPVAGKVAIATGGGSGHLPVFLGYVGRRVETVLVKDDVAPRRPPRPTVAVAWPG